MEGEGGEREVMFGYPEMKSEDLGIYGWVMCCN